MTDLTAGSRTPASRMALVRRPGPRLAEGLLTHRQREHLDLTLARRQWQNYVDALHGADWAVIEVPPADDCPDGVFIEDTMVVYRDTAIIARPGAEARRAETADAETTIASLGYRLRRIDAPGTLDGGDVLKVGETVYVGRGSRTNDAGISQLAHLLAPLGAQVVAVPISKVLHLKSAVTALPDGTVIGYPPLVEGVELFGKFMPVPEGSGSHVVDLGNGQLLTAADCPGSQAIFRDLGYEPIAVDISEFDKLEGCVTCLSVRLR